MDMHYILTSLPAIHTRYIYGLSYREGFAYTLGNVTQSSLSKQIADKPVEPCAVAAAQLGHVEMGRSSVLIGGVVGGAIGSASMRSMVKLLQQSAAAFSKVRTRNSSLYNRYVTGSVR